MVHSSLSTFSARRCFLGQTGLQFGACALSQLLTADQTPVAKAAEAAVLPHHPAPARAVIYLHMIGAPSQLDLFDEKPELVRRHDQPCPPEVTKGRDFAFIGKTSALAGSPWRFQQHGQSGQVLSELLPHLGGVADELAVIRSIHSDEINHAPAQMMLHTGFGRAGRPSVGSWINYGLAAETQNLPGYVVLLSGPPGGAGTSLWASGFLPGRHQGIQFRSQGDPVLYLSSPEGYRPEQRRRELDALRALNEEQFAATGDPEILTRISQYEMAWRMQASVPELSDLSTETQSTLDLYGVEPGRPSFGANCLMARRLVERGVRMVELYDADWDHHGGIETALPRKCMDVDQPMAALIRDLRQRGLLDQTLVVWGSEFGRTPLRQGGSSGGRRVPGRDHHKDAFTMWLAGGGIRGGTSWGRSDDFGMDVAEDGVHVHDLNATILHLLGLDHERLTFRHQGREYRLTDVHGNVVDGILA